jgi:type IV pilus assembly protein PilY1
MNFNKKKEETMKAKNIKNKIIISLFATLCAFSSSVFADDIQIYTGNKGDVTESNILFMVDVSGSMGWDDPTRILQVKAGLVKVLQDLPDKIKVGIGIYNGGGGSIIHPIKRLGGIAAGNIVSEIIEHNDDGFELGITNTVHTDTTYLPFSGLPSTTVEASVVNNGDDAEECSDGSEYHYVSHSYLDVNIANCGFEKNRIGTIFRDLNIPKNATILNAYVEYTHNRNSSGKETDAIIVIEDSVRPYLYNYSRKLSTRNIYNFGNTENIGKISWLPVKGGTSGTRAVTPNIAPLIQAIVNRSDWNPTQNGFNIMVQEVANGRREDISFATRDSSEANAAKIVIEYSSSSGESGSNNSNETNSLALRFKQLMVPSNINMTEGTLHVAAHGNVINGGTITVKLATLSDSGEIIDIVNDISSRSILAQKDFSFNTWVSGNVYEMDVQSLYESAFNTTEWCAGDDLFLILESSDLEGIKSSEAVGFQSPKVTISFDSASEQSCGQVVNYYDVDNYSNDGYVDSSGVDYITQNYVLIGKGNTTAVRFNNMLLTNEDVVDEAYIRFSSVYDYTGEIPLRISADISNFNNPKEYVNSSGQKISDRVSGLLFPVDTSVGTLDANDNFRTGNIASIVNSLIQRGDWVEGNSISLLMKGLDQNFRYAYSNDYSISEAPRLYLKIKKKGTTTTGNVRSKLIELVQSLKVKNGTPTLGSSFEAYQYFTGKDVLYGKKRYDNLKRVSHPLTWSGGVLNTPAGCDESNYDSTLCQTENISGSPKYITPITDAVCETNNIIMITDGYPTNQSSHYLPDGTTKLFDSVKAVMGEECSTNWDCLFKFSNFMAENDLMPNVEGIQNVYTNVIGFGEFESKVQMEQYADAGLGSFYPVSNVDSLSVALEIIVSSIIEVETTIATPGVSVNQNNKFQFLNELYYSVFKPSKLKGWKGNLKKYKIKASNTNGTAFDIIDKNGAVAIDPASGFFKEGSQSFWSEVVDGRDVTLGGTSEQFTANRNLFTFTESGTINNISLNNNEHKLNRINPLLTKADFGIQESWSDDEFNNFLDWVGGKDIRDEDKDGLVTDARKAMADPLHAQPIVVNYSNSDATIFVSTNEGFLHGIDSSNGKELFAFAPKELLPIIYDRYRDRVGTHLYGLDASWVAYRHDADKSGSTTDHTDDFMYLYGGMRRGGKSLFALDISETYASNLSTNIAPKIKYVINSTRESAFADMGETWSVPVLSKVMYNGSERIVMLFGGGYDTANDDHNALTTSDTLGRQIYMVDAATGQLLWWASGTDTQANTKLAGMNYSIPSKLSILDLNGDGLLDYIYASDMGGQILKFKVDQDNHGASDFADAKIFAKLGKTDPLSGTDITNNRKFYERPTIVPVLNGHEKFLAIIVGSGHRASPLSSNVEDALFVVKDKEILLDQLIKTNVLYKKDLADITYDIDENSVTADIASKEGYIIWLKEGVEESSLFLGEKSMGEAVAFNNSVIFTTYFPQAEPKSCSPVVGNSRSYRIDLATGMPHESNEEDTNDETPNQKRYVEQTLPGLASGTKIIYTNEGVIALTNTSAEGFGLTSGLGLFRSSWYPKHEKNIDGDVKLIPPHLRAN